MKALKKTLAILMVFSMVLSLGLVTAFASSTDPVAEQRYQDFTGADAAKQTNNKLVDVNGSEFTFKKYLVVPKGMDVPNVDFKFTIEGGVAISLSTSSNTVMQVDSGDPANAYAPYAAAATSGLPVFVADTTANNKVAVSTTTKTNDTATVSFEKGDSTITGAGSAQSPADVDVDRTAADRVTGLNALTGVEYENAQENYVRKTLKLDFSNVTFYEPGIYRYIIREVANATNTALGIMQDNHTFRILDVYVTDKNDGSGTLEVKSYVLHKGAGAAGAWVENPDVPINTTMGSDPVLTAGTTDVTDKTDGFTNEYKPYHLVVKKQVYGNQASRDKYFEVTVRVDAPTSPAEAATAFNAAEFKVSLNNTVSAKDKKGNDIYGNANATSGTNAATIADNAGKTNKTTVTGAELTAGVKFYLQHGQSIAVLGLPADATYTVTENAEDYQSLAAGTAQAGHAGIVTNHQNETTGKLGEQDAKKRVDGATAEDPATDQDGVVYTSYLNVRNGTIPTGIISVIAPAVAVIVLGGAGLGFVVASKRREEEEEA